MKILHITQLLGVGGLERLIQGLMLEQKKSGHQVALLVYGDDQTWVPRFRSLGLEVFNDYKKTDGYDKKLLGIIRDRARSFDIIHTHDLNPAMYVGPLRALSALGIFRFPRWVHTAHGMDHISKRPITTWYERIFTRFSDGVVGVASHICATYHDKIWLSKKRIHQIDNGILLNAKEKPSRSERMDQLKSKYGVTAEGSVWICVSRVVPLKDQRLILAAARELPRSTFLLVGPSGDEVYWNELKKECPANVIFLGGQDDVPELLSLADFYLSPSHHEGIPLAVLEAAAHSLPAVLSGIPGHRNLQRAERPIALFFKTGSVADCVAMVTQIERDPPQAQRLAQEFNSVVRAHYSQERMATDYERVYRQVTV